MLRPRKAVERLKKYRPPLEGRGGKLRLDFNENTVGCAPEVVRAMRRALTAEKLTRYPEYAGARATLAKYFGVAEDEILLTNGTDDAIKLICDAFVDPGDTLLIPTPTFPVYQFFHQVAGGRVFSVPCDEDFALPLAGLLKALKKRVRWMALANPNNPTGTTISKKNLATLLRAAPRTLVLADEAYFDFCGETVLGWIRKYENLVVTRTFSKAFGLAALRMGCMFANAQVTESLHRAHFVDIAANVALVADGGEPFAPACPLAYLGDVLYDSGEHGAATGGGRFEVAGNVPHQGAGAVGGGVGQHLAEQVGLAVEVAPRAGEVLLELPPHLGEPRRDAQHARPDRRRERVDVRRDDLEILDLHAFPLGRWQRVRCRGAV